MKNTILLFLSLVVISSCRKPVDEVQLSTIIDVSDSNTSIVIGDSLTEGIMDEELDIMLQGDCYYYFDINQDSINDIAFIIESGGEETSSGGVERVVELHDSLIFLGFTDSNDLQSLDYSEETSCDDFNDNLPCQGVFTTHYASAEQPQIVYNGPWQDMGVKYFAFKLYDTTNENWSLGWFEVESSGGITINVLSMGVIQNTTCE